MEKCAYCFSAFRDECFKCPVNKFFEIAALTNPQSSKDGEDVRNGRP